MDPVTRTVYIVNRGGHDFSEAERFGRLVYLSEGMVEKYAVDKMYRMFAERLRSSAPDDFILITGMTIMSCIACSSFSYLHNGRLNILLFKNGRYLERKLRLDQLLTTNKETERQLREMQEGE